MSYGFLDIAATPSVRAAQAAMGSEHLWQNFNGHREFEAFTPDEVGFIAQRDSFYMSTVSQTGWPYIQHRGGAAGFLKVVDTKTLAFADYRGNRQYISLGNLAADDRVAPDSDGLRRESAPQDLRPCRGHSPHCRSGAHGAGRRAGLQSQTRTNPVAASRGVRLELPATHHPAVHGEGDCGSDASAARASGRIGS
jgi:hypothetical protein